MPERYGRPHRRHSSGNEDLYPDIADVREVADADERHQGREQERASAPPPPYTADTPVVRRKDNSGKGCHGCKFRHTAANRDYRPRDEPGDTPGKTWLKDHSLMSSKQTMDGQTIRIKDTPTQGAHRGMLRVRRYFCRLSRITWQNSPRRRGAKF